MLRQLGCFFRLMLFALLITVCLTIIAIGLRPPPVPGSPVTPPTAFTMRQAYFIKSEAPVAGYSCSRIECEVIALIPGGSAVSVLGALQGEALYPVLYGNTTAYVVENWLSAQPVAGGNLMRPRGGATAICADGWVSYSAHRQGTCSHHRGVKQWYHRPRH